MLRMAVHRRRSTGVHMIDNEALPMLGITTIALASLALVCLPLFLVFCWWLHKKDKNKQGGSIEV